MVDEQPNTTRRAFVATGALLFGGGCLGTTTSDEVPEVEPTTRTPTPTGTPTETPTRTPTEEPTETPTRTPTEEPTETPTEAAPDPADDRTVDLAPNVTPAYQGAFVESGRPVDNFEALDRWTVRKGGELGADADHRFTGSQSLSYEGAGRTVVVGDYGEDPIDLTDEDISLAAKFDAPTDAQPTFYVTGRAPDRDNVVIFGVPYDGPKEAGWQRFDLAPIETRGDPDLSEIRRLKISLYADGGTPVAFNIDDLRAHPKPDRGKIIFRFDDSHASHYDDYFPVLRDRGYPGVEAVVRQRIGNSDRLSVDQLRELQAAGWDLCNHTTAHQNVRNLSAAELRRDVRQMNRWFDRHGIERGTEMHVHTFNDYDGRSLDVLGDYFELAFSGGGATNYSLTNPLTVSSFNARAGVDATTELIDRVAKHRSLAVLMFHDRYSRSEFEAVVDHVAADDRLDVISGSDLRAHVYSRT